MLAAVAFCVLAAAAGVIAAHFIESPADAAAKTASPPSALLTAPVKREVLTSTLVERGSVTSEGTVTATPASEYAAGITIVTALPIAPGSNVPAGAVVAEVSGRPIFVLHGALPAYRDLRSGDKGRDVHQLQSALSELGLYHGGDPAGTLGSKTLAAVSGLYQRGGYDTAGQSGGVYLPLSEVVYVPDFPATLQQVGAPVGGAPTAPFIKISYGPSSISVQASPADLPLLKQGAAATLTNQITGTSAPAKVTAISAVAAGTDSSSPSSSSEGGTPFVPVTLTPEQPLPADWAGQDVEVQITSARTAGPVLVVPISAVQTEVNGRSYVTVIASDGHPSNVTVTVGADANGFIAVAPLSSRLVAGSRVEVGQG